MGDTTSIESENIMDKIEFFQHSEDSFFGKIDIYKFKEPPYEYVIDYKKNYVDNKQRISKDEALMNQLKNIEHPNLAKIYYCQQVEGNTHFTKMPSSASSIKSCTPTPTTIISPSSKLSKRKNSQNTFSRKEIYCI